jgi:hypothetical protein
MFAQLVCAVLLLSQYADEDVLSLHSKGGDVCFDSCL